MGARIYLAGPLFTTAERTFNTLLAMALRGAGHTVQVPQEYEPEAEDPKERNKEIFDADVEMIETSDVVVANVDGPDVDSGTAWEIGFAWAETKPIIGFRTDIRAGGDGGDAQVNLMISEAADKIITVPVELTMAQQNTAGVVRFLVEEINKALRDEEIMGDLVVTAEDEADAEEKDWPMLTYIAADDDGA